MADLVEARFDAAVCVVRSMPKKGPFQPSYEKMLKFYAYYKQAKEGECFESKPGFWDVVRKAKWEAWHALGKMSKHEAMESYVAELKKAIENVPDFNQPEELNEAFRSFYQVVYKDQDVQPPPALSTFEEKASIKINEDLQPNALHSSEIKNASNEVIEMDHLYGAPNGFLVSNKCHVNGLQDEDIMGSEGGKNHDLNGRNISNGIPVVIVESNKLHNNKTDDEDTDSGIKDGELEGSAMWSSVDGCIVQQPRQNDANGVTATVSTDESEEEEFCDSLEPEHLEVLQNGHHIEGDKIMSVETTFKTDKMRNSDADSSPDQTTNSVYSESENSDLENELNSSKLLTSTPFSKHVTFAVGSSQAVEPVLVNNETLKAEPLVREECPLDMPQVLENGHDSERPVDIIEYESFTPFEIGSQKLAGILKPSNGGRVHGGGDAGESSTGKTPKNETRTSRGTRTKDTSGTVTGIGHLSRRYAQRSDSDSDDDHTSGPDYDSPGDGNEVNQRILEALERLHQDMKKVLRRLTSVEEAIVSAQTSPRITEPWWKAYVPSQAVMFLILWPFLVNIVIYYFRGRKR